jgi:Protein of unknown function (DUF3515)
MPSPSSPARTPPTTVLTVVTAGMLLTLLTGCGGPGAVRLTPPHPAPPVSARCAALARGLPARLDGQARRAVSPASPLTAAWGNPPITLRCGVAPPAPLNPASELVVVNNISWFPEPAGGASPSRFTEVGREAYVEVSVPAPDAPAGPVLVAVSNAIIPVVPAKAGGKL